MSGQIRVVMWKANELKSNKARLDRPRKVPVQTLERTYNDQKFKFNFCGSVLFCSKQCLLNTLHCNCHREIDWNHSLWSYGHPTTVHSAIYTVHSIRCDGDSLFWLHFNLMNFQNLKFSKFFHSCKPSMRDWKCNSSAPSRSLLEAFKLWQISGDFR